jgi:hypothetical protein
MGTVCAPCARWAASMPITMEHEHDNVYRLEIRGMLRKADLDRCQEALAGEAARIGPVKLLFDGHTIERIAIVGDERWKSQTLMFAGADLRRAPVEFFSEDAVDQARAWLSA